MITSAKSIDALQVLRLPAPAPAIAGAIPSATYRLQFNRHFTLAQAIELVDYLQELGISDCYASPLTAARPDSLHGYDVLDHGRLNPDIGTEAEFQAFAQQLKRGGMGLILDIVPNHMGIAPPGNNWWLDVLENEPAPFASYFDIDWRPPKAGLANKVLLPILGDQYGLVLENQEIQIIYEDSAFFARYYDNRLPLAPCTWPLILQAAAASISAQLGESDAVVLELESIITALEHLAPPAETAPARVRERRREKDIVKGRLTALTAASAPMQAALAEGLRMLNGSAGQPRSFDRLEDLLAQQPYRLSHWRVAADEINYRRFFDINELAAIRVEDPEVFNAVHALILRLIREGGVIGLRVDHVDGLSDPQQYLHDLQQACSQALAECPYRPAGAWQQPFYIVVEKILTGDEQMSPLWPVNGTTGYDFLNLVNGLFINRSSQPALERLYRRFTGTTATFADLAYRCKKLIMQVAMAGQIQSLASQLERISEQHRLSRDFTRESLRFALQEVIACFPVYRSYVRAEQRQVAAEDQRQIRTAVGAARRRNPATSASIFHFIGSILLLEDPPDLEERQREERRSFIMLFQQLTGPIMAKGLEDTAFYRFYPLASLNEVGGDPERFGVSPLTFHRQNRSRLAKWPHGMLATSTHDTKRCEDMRARLDVLSEIPRQWESAIYRWQGINRARKISLDGHQVPDANEEYLLYQTLIGAWPLDPEASRPRFVKRVQEYMNKALKEAKVHTSWINPDEDYDRAVRDFIAAILDPAENGDFLADFRAFQAPLARAGLFNSLSQTLLKIASPGVPDFYQGSELWNFHLVDPDNRQLVDYGQRRTLLAGLQAEAQVDRPALLARLLQTLEDGRLKLYVTSQALSLRRQQRELFTGGDYWPLHARGEQRHHVVALARRDGEREVVAVAARFFLGLGAPQLLPLGRAIWDESAITLGRSRGGTYRDAFSGRELTASQHHGAWRLPLADVFAHLPVALLERLP